MTSHLPSPLPERPNLEHLRKLAKSLLHAARAGDEGALERFRLLAALAGKSVAELGDAGLALHDAQSVIAREHGFQSWNALREHVEERSLSFAAAVDEFVRCATGSAAARAQRLLALHPGIAHASLQAELVLGDVDAVRTRLRSEPALATKPGGIQNWEPLLYVCHTCLHRDEPPRAANLAAIATELLDRGANPNAEYHWQWHPELPRTALWGALCATSDLPLAEILLQRGANPTDGVSTHITAGSDNIEALELLHRYGMNPNGIAGGVPPLRYILSWADKTVGVQWLLEHGADPNLSWEEHGDAPVHIAAQRWDVSLMELLARHGAAVDPLDGMFAAPPLVWAAEGIGHAAPKGADYVAVARVLMAAGSPTTWTPPEKAPDPEATQEALLELCRAAGARENAKPL
jgi:hypothetical protein